MHWKETKIQTPRNFKCGYCNSDIVSEKGYYATTMIGGQDRTTGKIYICHKCSKPTFFDNEGYQTPGPKTGNPVKHIPEPDVEKLFNEAKDCFSINAFTSSVMCCRKLLMNISVSEGAEEGKNFVEYVNFLNDKNYIPPKGKEWVNFIRQLGNEANHKIDFKSKEDALKILNFTEMLLRFIYELPGIMNETTE